MNHNDLRINYQSDHYEQQIQKQWFPLLLKLIRTPTFFDLFEDSSKFYYLDNESNYVQYKQYLFWYVRKLPCLLLTPIPNCWWKCFLKFKVS